MECCSLLLMTFGGFAMLRYSTYIKKQMMIADGPPSPKQARASKFIGRLVEGADGDFARVFRLTQAILVMGLFVAILGGVLLLAYLNEQYNI